MNASPSFFRTTVAAGLLALAPALLAQFTPQSLTSTPGTSPAQPLSLVAGTTYTNALSFSITFNQLGVTISSIEVRGAPPGLTLDGGTQSGNALVVSNRPNASFSGTPTTTGFYTVQVNAITSTGLNSISQVSPWEIYFNITGTSTGGGGGGGGGGQPPPTTPPPTPPPASPLFDTNSPGAQLQRFTVLSEQGFMSAAARQHSLESRLALGTSALGSRPQAGLDSPASAVCAEPPAASADRGTGTGLYAHVSYSQMDFDTALGLPSADSTTSSAVVGGDWRASDNLLLGALLALDATEMDLDRSGSAADVDSVAAGAYARVGLGPWSVLASVLHSSDDYTLRRHIIAAGVGRTAGASPGGSRTDLAVTLSYDIRNDNWLFVPKLGIVSSTWEMDGYTEAGNIPLLLQVAERSVDSFRVKAGADIIHHGPRLTHRVGVSWHEELKDERTARANLVGSSSGFAVNGRPPPTYLLLASYGIDSRLSDQLTAYGSIAAGFSDSDSMTADFSAGIRWSF